MAEVQKQQTAQIRRCATGGSEIWVWGVPEDGECWAQGWHSPKPMKNWWATKAEEWTLIGYKLMVIDTEMAKKSFFVHPKGYNFVDSDGNETHFGHARLEMPSPEGGKGPPNFVKMRKGKGKGPTPPDHPPPKKRKTKRTSQGEGPNPPEGPNRSDRWSDGEGETDYDGTWSSSWSWSETWSSSSEVKPKPSSSSGVKPKPARTERSTYAIGVRPPY